MKYFSKIRGTAIAWLMAMFFAPVCAMAQITVSGTVYEEDGTTPMTGATVMVKGSSNAVSTDLDGHYQLNNVKKNATLRVFFIGYTPQEVKVDGRDHIDFKMVTDAVKLDDVVVTALGISREQKSLGYAVSKVSNEDLTSTVSGNWLNAMNGRSEERRVGKECM